jgi:hypothetical protein
MMILLFWVKSSGQRGATRATPLVSQNAAAEGSRVRPMGPLSFGPLVPRRPANDYAAEKNFHSLRGAVALPSLFR